MQKIEEINKVVVNRIKRFSGDNSLDRTSNLTGKIGLMGSVEVRFLELIE